MTAEVSLKGIVKDGIFTYYAPTEMKAALLPLEGEEVTAVITKKKAPRSLRQNNWYNGVAIRYIREYLLETQGEKYTRDDIHDWHLSKVVRPEVITKELMGQTIVVYKVKKTSEMSTIEFNEFKELIQAYWAERDLYIPDPNE
jgi:hypothetical protein